jgi:hypothetical protein
MQRLSTSCSQRRVARQLRRRARPTRQPWPARIRAEVLGLGLVCCAACAFALELPGGKPGDAALSCGQIYAEGMAESQRDLRARDDKLQAQAQRQQGLMGLAGTAMATGGLVGGRAAQAAAEDLAKSQNRLLDGANQANPRKERLRELWNQKRCTTPSSPVASGKPVDEAMTCAQIAAEMVPYTQQILPSVRATAMSQRQLNEQATALGEKQRAENNTLAGMWSAGTLDPTGIAKRAAQEAAVALHGKQKAESDALRDSSQYKQTQSNAEQMVAQGRQLEGDSRLQQLMRLGQQKGCDRR